MTAAVQPILSNHRNVRRWADLSRVRVTLALAVAPALLFAVATALSYAAVKVLMPWEDWRLDVKDAQVGAVIVVWWLLFFWTYLLLVTRRVGRIARIECLLVGVATSVLAPLALAFPWSIIYRAEFIGVGAAIDYMLADMRSNIGFTVIFTTMLSPSFMPFGALGSWIFWRVAVRPATTPVIDAATVFE